MATDHYIPQSLLERFADHTMGGNLNVLDKITGKLFFPTVGDFGVEDYNTFSPDVGRFFEEFGTQPPRIEVVLNEVFESPSAPVLAKVVKNSTLEGLTPEERQLIIQFVAVQWVRTPGRIFGIRSAVAEACRTQEPARTLRVYGTPSKPDQMRDPGLMSIPYDAMRLAGVLRRAHLALALAPGELAVVGDDPVVACMYRKPAENFYVANPVSMPDSDAFLPISPRHILYLHTENNAITGTVGRTLPAPLHLSADAMNYLNGLQGKAAVKYIVMPRQDQEAQLKTDISTETSGHPNFKRVFYPTS